MINTHVIPTVKENINSAYMKDVYFANAAKGNKFFFHLKVKLSLIQFLHR